MPGLSQKNCFFFLLLFLLVSAYFYGKSYSAGQSQRLNNQVKRERIVCSALQNNGSVNKITQPLNNASGRPVPSFEGKFGPIALTAMAAYHLMALRRRY